MLVNSNKHSLITPIKIFPIVFRNFNRNINPTFCSGKLDLVKAESECSLVKSKGNNVFENRLGTFVNLNRFKCLGSNAIGIYDELGRQVKLGSCFIIAKMVKVISIVGFGFKSFISNIRNSFGVLLHSVKKQFIKGYLDFDCSNRLHISKNMFGVYKYCVFGGERQFLSTLKCGVSLPEIL
jgi:hypothetical protein